MRRTRIKPGQSVDVRLTPQERNLILERTFIDDAIAGRLRGATLRGSSVIVRLTLDDVDNLAGHVAAEANHCPEPRVRRVLDAVYDRLTRVEQTFTEEEGPAEAVAHASQQFTAKQGQYLAYICYYTKIHGRPPAESDLQAILSRHAAGRTSDDQNARRARTDRASTRCSPLHPASVDAGAVA